MDGTEQSRLPVGWVIGAVLTLLLGCALMGMAAPDDTSLPRLEAARARWTARAYDAYQIAVRVEALGRVCIQRLEVRSGWIRNTLDNTCDALWLDELTVDQLFELGEEIGSIPRSRCYPSQQSCPCQRVFNNRRIFYDEELGYPTMLVARSEVQYHLTSPDFWLRLWEERELPHCSPAPRRLTVQVMSLTPID